MYHINDFISDNYGKIIAGLGIVFALSNVGNIVACSKANSASIETLLSNEEVQSQTLMDELDSTDNNQVIEDAEQLEHYIEIYELLEDKDYSKENIELDEAQKAELLNLSVEEVKEYIKMADDENFERPQDIKDNKTLKATLAVLRDTTKQWIDENGYDVSFKLLMATAKCSIANEFNVPVEDYNSIKILPEGTYDGLISIEGVQFHVSNDSPLYETIKRIYEVQGYEAYYKTIDSYKENIHQAKELLIQGSGYKKDSKTFTKR